MELQQRKSFDVLCVFLSFSGEGENHSDQLTDDFYTLKFLLVYSSSESQSVKVKNIFLDVLGMGFFAWKTCWMTRQEPRSAQGWECPWRYPQLHVSSGQEQSYLRKENNRKLLAHPKDTEVEEKFPRDAQHPQELGQNPNIPLGTSSKELLLSHGAPESAHCRS